MFEDTFLFSDSIAANIAFADPDASMEAITRAARLAGAARVHRGPARGLRDADRRARLLPLGRPAPAARHRSGDPRRPAGADPRRRHLVGGPHQGARDPRCPRRGDARPHHDRHRPPAGHHRAGRPRRAARATGASSPTAPTTSLLASSAALPRGARGRRGAASSRRPVESTAKWRGSTDDVDAGWGRRGQPARRRDRQARDPPGRADAAALPAAGLRRRSRW